MKYEIGKEYKFDTQRKGKFVAKVISQNDEWIDCLITKGTAKA